MGHIANFLTGSENKGFPIEERKALQAIRTTGKSAPLRPNNYMQPVSEPLNIRTSTTARMKKMGPQNTPMYVQPATPHATQLPPLRTRNKRKNKARKTQRKFNRK
jgi:hypothetical protein